jgi:S-formylglutathione hydrolase FrmB
VAPGAVDLVVRSPAVGADVPVRLLLPRGFRAEGQRRWPVLLLLHGCCSGYRSWTQQTDIEAMARRSGIIVAMPDGGRAGLYSDWLDGPQWETFHTEELLDLLKEQYAANGRHAVAGLSMGGLGALGYAARNPDLFEAAASFSGITDTLHNRERPDNYLGLVRSEGQDPLAVWGDPRRRSGLDLLEYALWQENRALRRALRAAGVEATFDFYGPGTHSWPYWERALHRAWPLLVTALRP